MNDKYSIEKLIWTQEDFEQMGWHDCKIWSFIANSYEYEFLIDLDYIFKWVQPSEGESYFKFWVAPVTMVFENSFDVKIDIQSQLGEIEIACLHMENSKETINKKFVEHTYRFECHQGEILLTATGFKMFVRQYPGLSQGQWMDYDKRGGINFDRKIKSL
jgi:hypothetical protein